MIVRPDNRVSHVLSAVWEPSTSGDETIVWNNDEITLLGEVRSYIRVDEVEGLIEYAFTSFESSTIDVEEYWGT